MSTYSTLFNFNTNHRQYSTVEGRGSAASDLHVAPRTRTLTVLRSPHITGRQRRGRQRKLLVPVPCNVPYQVRCGTLQSTRLYTGYRTPVQHSTVPGTSSLPYSLQTMRCNEIQWLTRRAGAREKANAGILRRIWYSMSTVLMQYSISTWYCTCVLVNYQCTGTGTSTGSGTVPGTGYTGRFLPVPAPGTVFTQRYRGRRRDLPLGRRDRISVGLFDSIS